MKKFLVLMMVLGMATMANAALQISVDSDKEPVDSMITIAPSDHLVLGIWTDTVITSGIDDAFYAAIVVNNDKAYIDYTTGVILPVDPGLGMVHDMGAVAYGWVFPAGVDGEAVTSALFALPSLAAGTLIWDEIDFHCVAFGDATIQLWIDYGAGAILQDTVIIHQIPEPMTMALLGLGGLFLRRRK